jgi:hypothetical protein
MIERVEACVQYFENLTMLNSDKREGRNLQDIVWLEHQHLAGDR